jgi:hypothetical protein
MDILGRCAFHTGMVSRRLTLLIIQSEALALPLLNVRQFGFRVIFLAG